MEKQFDTQALTCVASTEKEIVRIRQTIIQPNCLNVFITIPCPVKASFMQFFKPFVDSWNADDSRIPIHWPAVLDCSPEDVKEMMLTATTPGELPDIFTTFFYDIIFSKEFHRRFIETGLFGGISKNFYPDCPPSIVNDAEKFHVAFLGFSSWGIVRDLTVKGNFPVPKQWEDLSRPEYKGLFSIHGGGKHAGSLSLLMELRKKKGDVAIRKFAENTKKVYHFAGLIKSMGTGRSETPYYVLPYVAIVNIPSSKKVEILKLSEGILDPMIMIVKQSKMEACKDIIGFLTGNKFKNFLGSNAYFQPASIDGIENHVFADLEQVSENYYDEAGKLSDAFLDMLKNKIEK